MFIAHLPAGYLLAKLFKIEQTKETLSEKTIISLALIGSVLPDFDLIYFYLFDNRQHLHHSYWTHIPVYWVLIYVSAMTLSQIIKHKKLFYISTILFCCIILHLILDTMVGGILWLYPFSKDSVSLA